MTQTGEEARQGTSGLDRSTELAFARTRAAHERTMMVWTRTALSLITSGFSINKFFQVEAPRRDEQLICSRSCGDSTRALARVLLAVLMALVGLLTVFVVLFSGVTDFY